MEDRSRLGRHVSLAAAALLGAALTACATTQELRLGCVSEEVEIYVDGRLLEERPDAVDLRADQPHKLYFKREGHEPRLIVLESGVGADGAWELQPRDVCVELVPVGLGRELTIELDESDGAR